MSGSSESPEGKVWWSLQEVCERTGLEAHVLRYWEAEFPQLRPRKGSNGTRQYREKELALVDRIRTLLLEEKLTIQAARRRMAEERDRGESAGQLGLLLPEAPPSEPSDFDRQRVVRELREVLDVLRFGRKSW
ncbi:MAG: MerR family transcriptional regulator [Fibrobacteria bacterium]|nr:MerR family transcriptional regulator [Fibrobacteria bacterium]